MVETRWLGVVSDDRERHAPPVKHQVLEDGPRIQTTLALMTPKDESRIRSEALFGRRKKDEIVQPRKKGMGQPEKFSRRMAG